MLFFTWFRILICLIFLIPGIWVIKDRDLMVSMAENRNLTSFPVDMELLDTSGFRKLEGFFDDRVAFRDTFISLYLNMKKSISQKSIDRRVIVGKQGWLFYTGDQLISKYRGLVPFSPEELRAKRESILEKKGVLDQLGIKYFYVVTPDKQSIYSEYLPDHIKKSENPSRWQWLKREIEREVSLVDFHGPLREAKGKGPDLYHKTDTHWNYDGVSVAFTALMKVLQNHFPDIKRPQFRLSSIDKRSGDLAEMIGEEDSLNRGHFVGYELKNPCAKYLGSKPNRYNQSFSKICSDGKYKVLIFRDSFFTALEPMTSEVFAQSTYIWRRFELPQDLEVVKKLKPDLIIEQVVERSL